MKASSYEFTRVTLGEDKILQTRIQKMGNFYLRMSLMVLIKKSGGNVKNVIMSGKLLYMLVVWVESVQIVQESQD